MAEIPQRFIDRDIRSKLAEMELIVSRGMPTVEQVANALRQIRDSKLYRLDFKNFDEYCKTRWLFSKSTARRIIGPDTAKIEEGTGNSDEPSSSQEGSKCEPQTVGTASTCESDESTSKSTNGSGLPILTSEQSSEQVENNDGVNGQQISQESAREPGVETVDEPVLDAQGIQVPGKSIEAFLAVETILQVGKDIDAISRRVKEITEKPGGKLIQLEDVRMKLRNAKQGVIQNRPTHICPLCQGTKTICICCNGDGWTAEHVFKRLTAESNGQPK
jgi:hypothetical protein